MKTAGGAIPPGRARPENGATQFGHLTGGPSGYGAQTAAMTGQDQFDEQILELLMKKVGSGREITLDSSVVEDTGLDSVSVMDFVMELEDEFDITVPLDQIAEVRTVRDLSAVVRKLTGSRVGA